MIAKSSLWSKCWPVLLIISLVSIVDKFTFALELPQEKGFWESTIKQSTSPKTLIPSTLETKEGVVSSESSRLIRLEEELSQLKQKLHLQDLKNEEYDETVAFVKGFKIKEKESGSSQKHEIETLKGIVSKVQSKEETRDDEMKQLKERVNQIETKILEDHHQHQIVKRQNSITGKSIITTRPPCIPKIACAFDFKDASVSAASSDKIATSTSSLDTISKSVHPPSSCKDLSTNGHTSNGIYLLYDSNAQKVSAAFCDFNKNKGNQLLLGFVNVKSLPKGVHFYAQRTKTFTENSAVIPFDRVLMNEGDGLDGSTGIFKAPKPGIYRFWFNGYKYGGRAEALNIDLRVNGVNVANAYGQHFENVGIPVGVHSVAKLKTGDEVTLIKYGDGWLSDDDTPDTHFSGWLVEEELIL